MQTNIITHNEQLDFASGKRKSTKLPIGVTYGEIHVYIEGSYTLESGDAVDGRVPFNILRELNLRKNNNDSIYGLSSEDMHKINYYDWKSKVVYEHDASNDTFEVLVRLDKAMILANQDVLPKNHSHPGLPITQLDLELVWCTHEDFFSTITNGSEIDDATATVIYEQVDIAPQEITKIYGDSLERYALPSLGAKQTGNLNTGTKLQEVMNIGTGNLIKKAILVTLTTSEVADNDIISEYQVKRTLPTPYQDLITRPFGESRADDISWYQLDALLDGVTVVDFDVDIAKNGKGILVESKEESLKLLAQVDTAGRIRWISEEYVVNREHVANGGQLVFGI